MSVSAPPAVLEKRTREKRPPRRDDDYERAQVARTHLEEHQFVKILHGEHEGRVGQVESRTKQGFYTVRLVVGDQSVSSLRREFISDGVTADERAEEAQLAAQHAAAMAAREARRAADGAGDSSDDDGGGGSAAAGKAAGPRVVVRELGSGKKRGGSAAPLAKNIEKWLAANPGWVVDGGGDSSDDDGAHDATAPAAARPPARPPAAAPGGGMQQ